MPIEQPISFPKPVHKEFTPLPEDVFEVSVKDLEYRQSKFTDEKTGLPKNEINITFSIEDKEHSGRLLWKSVSPFISAPDAKKQSVLTLVCDAAYGRPLTFEERERFYTDGQGFLNDLIGKRLRVTVKNTVKGDRTFSNIASFLKSKTRLEMASNDTDSIRIEDVPF